MVTSQQFERLPDESAKQWLERLRAIDKTSYDVDAMRILAFSVGEAMNAENAERRTIQA